MTTKHEPAPILRVFMDSSALIAAAFSDSGASYVLLEVAGLGLVKVCVSNFVRLESERNIRKKRPTMLPVVRALIREVLHTVPDADDSILRTHADDADPKDVPVLAAAISADCEFLVTLNERDFFPPADVIAVVRPSQMIEAIRAKIAEMDASTYRYAS